ncbi:hypothetical protein RB195_004365 [Necator americanus]|uniref:Uncharacterized protein n=1 Tax=Necator americanus TaxID=51031 RepID=A0ABR1BJQ0_NECAM
MHVHELCSFLTVLRHLLVNSAFGIMQKKKHESLERLWWKLFLPNRLLAAIPPRPILRYQNTQFPLETLSSGHP